MSALLPFHKDILERIHDPATSDLLVIARGLGLRRIVCTLMKIYDSPQSLVLLVNATQEEESEIGEELGIMGCRKPGLRVVGFETGSKDRFVLNRSLIVPFPDMAHKTGSLQTRRPDISHVAYPCR
jgi:DNA excision repair protein ERCC-4